MKKHSLSYLFSRCINLGQSKKYSWSSYWCKFDVSVRSPTINLFNSKMGCRCGQWFCLTDAFRLINNFKVFYHWLVLELLNCHRGDLVAIPSVFLQLYSAVPCHCSLIDCFGRIANSPFGMCKEITRAFACKPTMIRSSLLLFYYWFNLATSCCGFPFGR